MDYSDTCDLSKDNSFLAEFALFASRYGFSLDVVRREGERMVVELQKVEGKVFAEECSEDVFWDCGIAVLETDCSSILIRPREG